MKISNQKLITDLIERTNQNLKTVEELKIQSLDLLNKKRTATAWSTLECIEHLNRYGNFYLPEIKRRLKTSKKVSETTVFKSGVIGNYFAKMLMAKEKVNKIKTFDSMNPNGSELSEETILLFVQQQKEMLELLNVALNADLQKTKTSISISKMIKLRLGDTFRVVIYHNERHLLQAQRAIN